MQIVGLLVSKVVNEDESIHKEEQADLPGTSEEVFIFYICAMVYLWGPGWNALFQFMLYRVHVAATHALGLGIVFVFLNWSCSQHFNYELLQGKHYKTNFYAIIILIILWLMRMFKSEVSSIFFKRDTAKQRMFLMHVTNALSMVKWWSHAVTIKPYYVPSCF